MKTNNDVMQTQKVSRKLRKNKSCSNLNSCTSQAQCREEIFDNLIWMTIKDAARYLGRTENAIRIAVHRGQLPRHKWLGKLYFKRSDLDFLLERSVS